MDRAHTPEAQQIVGRLRDGAVRAVFRSLIRDEDSAAMDLLSAALGRGALLIDLSDETFREDLLEALEYRISPPDEEDTGPVFARADETFALEHREPMALLAA